MHLQFAEIKNQPVSRLFGGIDLELKRTYDVLAMGSMHVKTACPAGPCLAGALEAFVDVNGNIYPCEKVSESEDMLIGSLDDGFYPENIQNLLNIAQTTEEQCKNCWAFLFYTSCVAASIAKDGRSSEKRLSKCRSVKMGAYEKLRAILILMEQGYDFKKYRKEEVLQDG